MTNKRNYILDCYRVLAIIMVLSVHIRSFLKEIPEAFNIFFSLGAYGVALYFVISGYFSYDSVRRCGSFKEYIKKKAVRILPMYYVSLVLTFIIGGLVLKIYPVSFEWIYHVFFLNMFVPDSEWMWWNSVNFFWTMPSFIAWYLVSPFLFKYINNTKKMTIVTGVTAVLTPVIKNCMYIISNEHFTNWNFFCLLYVFLFGALAYFVLKEKKIFFGVCSGLVIVVLAFIVGNRSGFLVFGAFFYEMIILTSLIPLKWNNQKFIRILKLFSDSTYSIYLTHWFVLNLCGTFFEKLPWLLGYVLFIVLSGGLGYCFYRFVEKTAVKWFANLG